MLSAYETESYLRQDHLTRRDGWFVSLRQGPPDRVDVSKHLLHKDLALIRQFVRKSKGPRDFSRNLRMCYLTHNCECDTVSGRMSDGSAYLENEIRSALKKTGLTTYRRAKETGIHHSVIVRFLNGDRCPSLATASVLVEYLGLRLTPTKHSGRKSAD